MAPPGSRRPRGRAGGPTRGAGAARGRARAGATGARAGRPPRRRDSGRPAARGRLAHGAGKPGTGPAPHSRREPATRLLVQVMVAGVIHEAISDARGRVRLSDVGAGPVSVVVDGVTVRTRGEASAPKRVAAPRPKPPPEQRQPEPTTLPHPPPPPPGVRLFPEGRTENSRRRVQKPPTRARCALRNRHRWPRGAGTRLSRSSHCRRLPGR